MHPGLLVPRGQHWSKHMGQSEMLWGTRSDPIGNLIRTKLEHIGKNKNPKIKPKTKSSIGGFFFGLFNNDGQWLKRNVT
jgi:hypothetical protein